MDCIYIPFIENESTDLRFLSFCWRAKPPFSRDDNNLTRLILSIDQRLSDKKADQVTGWFEGLGFADIMVAEAGIAADEALYVRGMDRSRVGLKYGLKSGPNQHFLFNQRLVSGRYRYAFHHEVDMVPTGRQWFSSMLANLPPRFLISGPIYRGPSTLGHRGLLHVNGNAFYASSHPNHGAWVDMLDAFIVDRVAGGDPGITFDVATSRIVAEYLNPDASSLYEEAPHGMSEEDQVRALAASIHYNQEILNAAGKVENEGGYPLDFEAHVSRYCPGARLVHGRRFRFMALPSLLAAEDILTQDDREFLHDYIGGEIMKMGPEAFRDSILASNRQLRKAMEGSDLADLAQGS